MRSLILTEQDFEVLENVTSPAIMTPYASYQVPAGLYMEFDLSKPFIFKPVLVETFTLTTSMINTTNKTVTVTLSFPCVDDTPLEEQSIVGFDVDASVYFTLSSYNPSTKQVVFTYPSSSPAGHKFDVYYPSTQHFDKMVVTVPVGSGEDVYSIKSYDQGRLYLLDQDSAKQRLYLPKPLAFIEDFKLQFMTRDTLRHALCNIRTKKPLPNAKLELPLIVYSLSEAIARFGNNLKLKLINLYHAL